MKTWKGGRPKGSKGHRNDGLQKRCECARRRWSECAHPWFFNFKYNGVDHRFNLNKEAGKPNDRPLSKTDAEALRDRFRAEIREGTFRNGTNRGTGPDHERTVGDVFDDYVKRYVWQPGRRTRSGQGMEWYVKAIRAVEIPAAAGRTIRFEEKPLAAVTKADVEVLRTKWTGRRPGARGGTVAPNRMLSRLKHFFTWAIGEGITDHHPFKRHGVTVIKMDSRVEQPRTRRLHEGEEARLLEHAGAFLHALIIAAVDTGCRLNEMLSLQWKDVFFEQNSFLLHADKTKTYESRDVPITQRLRAVLEMRRTGPDGKELPGTAYVFGNEVGERRRSIRTAWAKTLKRAKITGLRFHDLRREFGSRLLESGASAHIVRDWLGHADITTTSRYLATTRVGLQKALKQFEEHRTARHPTKDSARETSTNRAQERLQ